MRSPLTRKLAPFGTSVFTEFTRLARQHKAINLSQGYPDFDGPDEIKRFACDRIMTGHNQYAPSHGMPALRQAVARKMQRFYGIEVDPEEEVTVFAGATEAIFSTLMGLVDPGDEVVIFEPAYDSYAPSVVAAGGEIRRVQLLHPDYAVDEQALRQAFSARTKVVLVNTPMNPCGKVFSRADLQLIADLCVQHDCFAVCDEVYEHIVFDDACHLPLITLPGMRERTVCISSTAKTFSMTGWKVGYAVASAALSLAIRQSHQFVTFCTPPPLQEAMAFALDLPDSYYRSLQQSYAAKRRYLVDALQRLGLEVRAPDGTYYIAAGISGLGYDDDYTLCRSLPERTGVAAIPVSAFYEGRGAGRQVIRVAFCKNEPTLQEAVSRLTALRQGAF